MIFGDAGKSDIVKHLVGANGERSANIVSRPDGKFRVIVNDRFGPGEDDWVGAKLATTFDTIEAAEAVARRALKLAP